MRATYLGWEPKLFLLTFLLGRERCGRFFCFFFAEFVLYVERYLPSFLVGGGVLCCVDVLSGSSMSFDFIYEYVPVCASSTVFYM